MKFAAFFTDLFGPDGGIVLALLVPSGLGMIGIMAWSLIQSRSDIRRRAQEGLTAPVAAKNDRKAQNSASLERLVGYLETTFSGGDPHERRLIRLQLVQAGFFDQRAVAIFFGARIAAAAVMGVGTLLALPVLRPEMTSANLWLATIGLAILGYFAPSFYIKRRIAQRVDQHRMGFPDFMDLMVVCAEAGLSMEAAIDRIARELVEGYPSLAENLYMVSLEIRAGKSFTEALERMGERLGIEEASMLAALLQQSAELGTSLSQSLRVYSDEMRNKRMSRAEEKAYALPAKLVVPLTLFVFPVLIVTLMYPAAIRLMTSFGNQ
ncbi:type II secretion system F family protein [Microvirga massiliensis]|uniref:type II secretion system F family protein n=1 Tax=Microvirga massiliensis TaxID=1033741 RepID=UPI00062BE413|nr:type II secretion system F family protein [Microvirga massiliensis]